MHREAESGEGVMKGAAGEGRQWWETDRQKHISTVLLDSVCAVVPTFMRTFIRKDVRSVFTFTFVKFKIRTLIAPA